MKSELETNTIIGGIQQEKNALIKNKAYVNSEWVASASSKTFT